MRGRVLITGSARGWRCQGRGCVLLEGFGGGEAHQEGTRKELGCQGVPRALG